MYFTYSVSGASAVLTVKSLSKWCGLIKMMAVGRRGRVPAAVFSHSNERQGSMGMGGAPCGKKSDDMGRASSSLERGDEEGVEEEEEEEGVEAELEVEVDGEVGLPMW